ncbi:TIGR03545 family protein [Sulfurimonas sp.]|uniref:TIGR03545 family protein n=1 Tax=Sulfurimonas sp. TaxID=2022749 RepID=UPI002619FDE1|nr:TIGR03545 family protein [Sulfurimonas sp.]MCW8895133.1 TIGR03545 family protein [Sulfurimonas sp.]MCW9068277.1 TIGR03545 family protein [Sulfurimonas sp.]
MFKLARKLFKALNSSGQSWQLSGAIVLAMFAGFLPSFSLILLDILLIALILNVNFGLFLLFTVIFSGVGYLFDPLFESIGYTVLTNDALNALFTSMYNSALFRWSSFNYTLVTGSVVVSTILAIPMLLILNKVVTLYREQIGIKLNEWKLTRWMNLFNEEAKSSSFFRWWGLGVFGGLTAAIIIIFVVIFDPLARMAIEKGLSYSLQTKVSVKDFSSSFSDLNVKISGIEVADKDKLTHNLVQVEDVEFDLGFSALVEKKAMIEKLNINALAFNEKRKVAADPYDSTYISQTQATAATKDKKSSSTISNPFSIPSVDDILAKEELKSVTEAQKLRADIQATKDKWTKILSELKNTNEVDEIKADAAALQKSLQNADISKIASAKSDIDKLKSKITSLKNKYTSLQKDFDADQKRLKKQIYELKNLPQQDIDRLKEKYSLSASGGANLIGTLMSDEIDMYMQKALKYYEMLRPYLNDGSKKEVKEVAPPRGEGRWIKYANLSEIPELVIKESNINIKLKEDTLEVKVKDLSSNQKLYWKPMMVHADATGKQYKKITVDILDDRRGEKAHTYFDVKATGFKTAALDIKALSMNDIVANAKFDGEVSDMNIKAKSNVSVEEVKLAMPSQKLVNDLLSGISKFNLDISLNGDIKKPDIKVKSDLDKQLASGMKSMVSKATKGFEKELTAGIMEKAGGSSEGLSADLGDVGSLLNSKQDALGGINTSFSPASGSSDLLKKFF